MNKQSLLNTRIVLLGIMLLMLNYGCEKEDGKTETNWIVSNYEGSYKNISYSEALIGSFAPGIYKENKIPDELKHLEHGRMEIEFKYNGGALSNFMPILYYGSINKNESDNYKEETQDHLVVEIGHYNVVPFPLENLFYTICYDRYPEYCRDTDSPIVSGETYTYIIDKKPEGIILQLKKGNTIVNSFPSAFFPDSAQLFFNDITKRINKNRGDSLDIVMMVGKGFVGFEKGLRDFNGSVSQIKVYKYTLADEKPRYELKYVKNQHLQNQKLEYIVVDNLFSEANSIKINYQFESYIFKDGVLIPKPENNKTSTEIIVNNQSSTFKISLEDVGLFKVNLETFNENNELINSSLQPIEVWVYPTEWSFEY